MKRKRIGKKLVRKWKTGCESTPASVNRGALSVAHRYRNFYCLSITNQRNNNRTSGVRPSHARKQFIARANRDVIEGGYDVPLLQSKKIRRAVPFHIIEPHAVSFS